MGVCSEGVWLPCGLNECLKIGRYHAGCHFSPHIDGPWVPKQDVSSIFTVVIYLNGPESDHLYFHGGETNFLRQLPGMQDNAGDTREPFSHIEKSKQAHEVICSVTPKTGRALIFRHDLLHEGAPLVEGTKFILRCGLHPIPPF